MRLSENPYAYVRTRVMRAMLLKKQEYDQLLKMQLGEITRFLQDSAYKKEIDERATMLSGPVLLESSLNANLGQTLAKLKRISDENLLKIISVYVRRWDIENIKTILRALTTGSKENLSMLIMPCGEMDEKKVKELAQLKSVEEVLKESKLVSYALLETAMKKYKESNDLAIIENALDQLYFNEVVEFSSSLPKSGTLFREFLETEIEIKNIVTLVRLKRGNIHSKKISEMLIAFDGKPILPSVKLLDTENIEEIFSLLKKTPYAKIALLAHAMVKEKNSLIDFENALKQYLLRKTALLSHQHPLSIDVILGYMFAKEREVENLKTIIKGKQLGVDEQFIQEQLVIA